jgi:hypothetical protein
VVDGVAQSSAMQDVTCVVVNGNSFEVKVFLWHC